MQGQVAQQQAPVTQNAPVGQPVQATTSVPPKKSRWWLWLIIVIVLIGLGIGIYLWLF